MVTFFFWIDLFKQIRLIDHFRHVKACLAAGFFVWTKKKINTKTTKFHRVHKIHMDYFAPLVDPIEKCCPKIKEKFSVDVVIYFFSKCFGLSLCCAFNSIAFSRFYLTKIQLSMVMCVRRCIVQTHWLMVMLLLASAKCSMNWLVVCFSSASSFDFSCSCDARALVFASYRVWLLPFFYRPNAVRCFNYMLCNSKF